MPQMREEYLQAIEAEVRHYPNGASVREIAQALGTGMSRRTLQYRLRHLVNAGRLHRTGERRAVKYQVGAPGQASSAGNADFVPVTAPVVEIQVYVRQPQTKRKPVGYNRDFPGAYYPNGSAYFTASERDHLCTVGSPLSGGLPAGTYAKQILGRLLIDLSWNSSRLEGNTYSLPDTFHLINFGEEVPGKNRFEAQMILNHKDAIEYLVDGASVVGFNRPGVRLRLAQTVSPDRGSRVFDRDDKTKAHRVARNDGCGRLPWNWWNRFACSTLPGAWLPSRRVGQAQRTHHMTQRPGAGHGVMVFSVVPAAAQ